MNRRPSSQKPRPRHPGAKKSHGSRDTPDQSKGTTRHGAGTKKGTRNTRDAKPQSGIPPLLEDLISQYICEKTGKKIEDPALLDRLRQSIVHQKAMYWREKPGKSVKYGRGYDILAYLAYHVPVYFTQFRTLLQELTNDGVLPDQLSVLDIGSGPGVVSLAAIDLKKAGMEGSLDLYALERSAEHVEAYTSLVHQYAVSTPDVQVHAPVQEDLTRTDEALFSKLPGNVSVISFQNVLAELEYISIPARAAIVLKYAELLDEKGFIILVEPAEMRHATSLRNIQRELAKGGLYVYAPCSFLWGSGCSPTSCWTFREDESIKSTALMDLLADDEEGYRFVNTDLKFAYVILTRQSITRCAYRIPRKTRMIRLSHLDKYAGRVISVGGVRLSADIGTPGMHIFKICDGTCRDPVYLTLSARNRRPGHSPLFSTRYGDPLVISGVLVKKHPKHQAWNLIIGPDTRIERPYIKNPEPAADEAGYDEHMAQDLPEIVPDPAADRKVQRSPSTDHKKPRRTMPKKSGNTPHTYRKRSPKQE